MAVKRSESAVRVLTALETIARHQPIGVTDLARKLESDKSAAQRALMTLADTGWIQPSPELPSKWILTAHILSVAHAARMNSDLVQRARRVLEALRDDSGESILLTVPDIRRFVVVDALESRQMLRTVPNIGLTVPVRHSATSRAVMPYLDPETRNEMLGKAPDDELLAEYAATRQQGYAVSAGDIIASSTNIAAPVFETDGRPVAAIVISAPSERLHAGKHAEYGAMVLSAARQLSRGTARETQWV